MSGIFGLFEFSDSLSDILKVSAIAFIVPLIGLFIVYKLSGAGNRYQKRHIL